MRTTVTLDSATEQLLRRAMAERGLSFKAALNTAIQQGLADLDTTNEPPFIVNASPLGLRSGIDPTRLNQLADDLDADAFLDGLRGAT